MLNTYPIGAMAYITSCLLVNCLCWKERINRYFCKLLEMKYEMIVELRNYNVLYVELRL